MTDDVLKQLKLGNQSRSFSIEKRGVDEESRTVDLAFSSEEPVERAFGIEILDHAPASVRLGRLSDGGPVLVGHDPDDHVGVVESVSIDNDRRGRVRVRFGRSARATEIFNDVVDGIRTNVSVGYRIHDAVLETRGDSGDTYRVTDWEPHEVSIVSIPADNSVGVNRELEAVQPPEEETRQMSEEIKQEAPAVDVEVIATEAREAEIQRIRKIEAAAEKFHMTDMGRDFINSGKSLEEFRAALLEKMGEKTVAQPAPPATQLDLSEKEVRSYSLFRAIRAASTGDWSDAGFERECSLEIADKLDREARGFFVPFDVQSRVMTAGTDTAGGHLVGTDHLAGSFIDLLRAEALAGRLGARFLSGLVGNVDIPRLDGGASFSWLAEDGNVSDSDGTLGNVTLSPKTIAGSVPMSRRLRKQSSPDVESIILNDLIQGAGLAIDQAVFVGTGAGNQPTGIINQSGINTATVADITNKIPTHAELVAFETALMEDNALRGNLSYVTTPAIAQALKTAALDAGSGRFINEGGMANGYNIQGTTQLSTGTTIFGNFADVLIGMWGVLDVMPDTAAKAASDGLVLRVFQDVDVAIRHPQSFCKNA